MMRQRDKISLRLNRNSITQIKAISDMLNEDFEELFNRIVEEGITQVQPDYTLKKELEKQNILRKNILECYALLRKKPSYDPTIYVKIEVYRHFLADITDFLLKKKFTQSDFLIITKIREVMELLNNSYPDEYSQIKKYCGFQCRTKPYKILFGRMMTTSCKVEPVSVYNINITSNNTPDKNTTKTDTFDESKEKIRSIISDIKNYPSDNTIE